MSGLASVAQRVLPRTTPFTRLRAGTGGEMLSEFCGAVVYAVYSPAINYFNAGNQMTRPTSLARHSIFATFPATYFHGSWVGLFVDQVVAATVGASYGRTPVTRSTRPATSGRGCSSGRSVGACSPSPGITARWVATGGYRSPARRPAGSSVSFSTASFVGQVFTVRASIQEPPEPGRVPQPETVNAAAEATVATGSTTSVHIGAPAAGRAERRIRWPGAAASGHRHQRGGGTTR